MPHPMFNNLGSVVAPSAGLPNLANAAGARNGAAVDRRGFQSALLLANVGAVTGGPSAQTYDLKLQDSDDGSTGWADVSGAAVVQKTSSTAGVVEVSINLEGVKRYIRVVETVALTGGTSPTMPAGPILLLGGAVEGPV